MANTYELISGTTLTGTAADFTFSSIPGTYTDLILKWNIRHGGVNVDNIEIKFNSSATGYSRVYVRGDGSATLSNLGTAQSVIFAENLGQGTVTTTNTFSNGEMYIPNYAGTSNKIVGIFGVTENNATTAYQVGEVATWSNTAAITSINLTASGGSFVANSSFYLYGIKNS